MEGKEEVVWEGRMDGEREMVLIFFVVVVFVLEG